MFGKRATAQLVPLAFLATVVAAFLPIGCRPQQTAGTAPKDRATPAPVNLISFDEEGRMVPDSAKQLEGLIVQARTRRPTEIFVAAHGWLNTPTSASSSYETMRDLMFQVAQEQSLFTPDYVPLRIGICWPSMKFPKTKDEVTSAEEKPVAQALSGVSDKDAPAADPTRNETFRNDVNKMQQLLKRNAQKASATFKADLEEAHAIFRRQALAHGIQPVNLKELQEIPNLDSIQDALQLYTYFQMKQRAGIVGAGGVCQMIARLQKEFPLARVHLIGHSFGCKVMLSALTGKEALPRPVDTVVLLQGAVSFQCFADRVKGVSPNTAGGYEKAVANVRGPIVATFSDKDLAVKKAYPAASRLAKQIGECDRPASDFVIDKWYQGLGAAGVNDVPEVAILDNSGGYKFDKGLYSINATKHVEEHDRIYNPHVAWLIWAAILRR
jgi:hypothetical protein